MKRGEIKARCSLVGKSLYDVQNELKNKGYTFSDKTISAYNTGRRTPQPIVEDLIIGILKNWENESKQY